MWLLQSNPSVGAFLGVFWLLFLVWVIVLIVGMWKLFEKAGHPGWAAIVPIYNAYVLLEIAGRPGWWLLLYLIPFVNLIVAVVVAIDVAKNFGQSAVFGFVLNFLLGGIGYLILGFGDYRYQKGAAMAAAR